MLTGDIDLCALVQDMPVLRTSSNIGFEGVLRLSLWNSILRFLDKWYFEVVNRLNDLQQNITR